MIKLTNETMTRPYTARGMKRMIGIRGCAIFKPQITVAYVGEFGMKTKDKKKKINKLCDMGACRYGIFLPVINSISHD